MKLKPVTREEWIEALESGKYKQGTKRMYNREDGTYCCLGVYLKLCGVDFSKYDTDDLEKSSFASVVGNESIVMERRLNLDTQQQIRLANLNDKGTSFASIAKMLRAREI